MASEPNKILLKLGDVAEWFGETPEAMLRKLKAKKIEPFKLKPTAKGLYKKKDILEAFEL
jgi:hypothetical protein